MEMPKPAKEHEWLRRLVGEWTYEGEMNLGPEQHRSSGTETIRAFGDLWTIGDMTGQMPGSGKTSKSIIALGYDQAKKRFVGTFISDMMDSLWVYDGALNGDVLTLDCKGPSFKGDGSLQDYQDVVEIRSDDEYVLWSQVKGDDGSWTRFMTMTFRRKK